MSARKSSREGAALSLPHALLGLALGAASWALVPLAARLMAGVL